MAPEPTIHVFGEADPRSLQQLRTSMGEAGEGVHGVLNADHHVGYSQPIGGGVAFPDHLSVSGVGFDIACLPAGSPVLTVDGCTVPIEAVRPGDPVACWDGARTRRVDPALGAVSRGRRPVLRLTLADGRALEATGDHQIRTQRGWRRIDALRPTDRVACTAFAGLPYETPPAVLDLPALREPAGRRGASRSAALAARGLWPLRPADPRFPALLRLLAYGLGGGDLAPDGKRFALYASSAEDADALAADVRAVGFRPSVHVRERGGAVRTQYVVAIISVHLHALLEAMGCPVGAKVRAWPEHPLPWLDALPAWQRAAFLSAFMSAEGSAPRLANGSIAPLAVKQAGSTRHAIDFVARIFASLGFDLSVTPSGPPRGDIQTFAGQITGGAAETMRYLREVGFNRCVAKLRAAAAILSVHVQHRAVVARRRDAVETARVLVASGTHVRVACDAVSASHGVPRSVPYHGLYGRGLPRRPKGWACEPDADGEVAWLPVAGLEPAGEADVYDVVTGDPAESFLSAGVVVHNCGNKAARTDLRVEDVEGDVPRLMDEIARKVSFGVGRVNQERVDHPVLERIAGASFYPRKGLRSKLAQRAANQLGTVGAGNHYVNLAADEEGRVWIGVHFGSRGFGHAIATGFINLAHGRGFDDGELRMSPDAKPVLLAAGSDLGQAYREAMELAGEYAYAGRDWVVDRVLGIVGARSVQEVHNHHNFAWRERHHGADVWVVRKGCTPAFPGQPGFVGGSMGDDSVILEGVDSEASKAGLYSTVHGAGRVMSRTQAAGKTRRPWGCPRCGWVQPPRTHKPGRCPDCGNAKIARRTVQVKPGAVDWDAVRKRLAAQGIVLRGGAADEAPEVYKRLPDVLAAHEGTIRVLHTLRPLGVAMAGPDIVDPFKD